VKNKIQILTPMTRISLCHSTALGVTSLRSLRAGYSYLLYSDAYNQYIVHLFHESFPVVNGLLKDLFLLAHFFILH
jgi:hypothetical protein